MVRQNVKKNLVYAFPKTAILIYISLPEQVILAILPYGLTIAKPGRDSVQSHLAKYTQRGRSAAGKSRGRIRALLPREMRVQALVSNGIFIYPFSTYNETG
jgi:hypothetical protein